MFCVVMKVFFVNKLHYTLLTVEKMISVWIFLSVFFVAYGNKIQCKNANNEDVDWFVAYKWPQNKNSDDPFIKKGIGFSYITATSADSGWTLAAKSINDSSALIANTLNPLYTNYGVDDLVWMLYNDETPNKTVSFTLGHTKGVVLANDREGIWLVHSVPRFPPLPSLEFAYPPSGIKFGQSFLCISLKSSDIDKIGQQMRYNEPQIYSSNVPSKLENLYPNLVRAVAKSWIKTAPWNQMQELTSSEGISFQSFAKSKKFQKDLYADWVAPTLQVNLLVETWPNGRGRLPSACHYPFKVFNVESIAVKNSSIAFSDHVDHSKWGIAVNSSNPWVCIGDINRMESQEERGGGTVCLKHSALWNAYKQSINEIENCPRFR
ncbi:Uncharacterized protein GBIM_15677 [Gryllus bimaculatus]|nr:Uncharacterized protein GBIM_15677 [Gryllus bimaculatus]